MSAASQAEKVLSYRVPIILRKSVLKFVNESELQLEELSTLIYNHFKVFFVHGETVFLVGAKQDGNIIKGNVVKRTASKKKTSPDASISTPTDEDSSFYDIKLVEKNEVVTAVPCSALRRFPYSPSKKLLQAFIQTNAKYVENSSNHFHWVLNKKTTVKPKKNVILNKALSEHKKNEKPTLILNGKRKLDSDSDSPKVAKKNEKASLKNGTLQPVPKKRKLEKLAKSPKSGVPPIWAKLLKTFPLEPEVVLTRLEDGNEGTSGSMANLQKCKSLDCGKENKASSSPDKKMKQMTLFDMKKKLSSPSANTAKECTVKIEKMDSSIPAAINVTCDGRKDQTKKLQKSKKTVDSTTKLQNPVKKEIDSKKIASIKSDKLQKKDNVKSDNNTIAVKSLAVESSFTKISFNNFASKINLNQEKVLPKSSSQGTLDGILRKGVSHAQIILTPLPPPTLVKTPPGFENEWFGDAAMVIQFISSYHNILQPDQSIPLSTAALMDAIMSGSKGFFYLNNILVCLLKTLVQGCSAEDYVEAGVSLSEVPITIYSVSELTRLWLEENESDEDSSVLDKKLDFLTNKELHELDPYDKLNIICCLCYSTLECYTIRNYVNEIQKTVTKLRNEKLIANMEKNKIKRMLKNGTPKNNASEPNSEKLSPEHKPSPVSFYGTLAINDSTENGSLADELQSGFTNRRISLQKAKEEKLKAEKLKQEQALKERNELKKQKDQEEFKKNLMFHEKEIKALKGLKPLGKDRNMTRYWLFSHFTPQLVIEKVWSEGIDAIDTGIDGCESKSPTKKANLDVIDKLENRWFTYETFDEVKALINSLTLKKINERNLKFALKSYVATTTATAELKPKDEIEHSNGDLDLTEAFRDELLDIHSKIIEGVLGNMGKPEKWLSKVDKANTSQDFAECLLALQESLYPKFYCGAFESANPTNRKAEVGKKEKPKKKGNLEEWQDMVKSCQTMSRLHVLLGLLSACIQWEKSSANTKCKVCRKNTEDTLLLCDNCSKGFHLGCLRPRLCSVPDGDWFCPSCKKAMEESEEEEEEESSEEEENKEEKGSDDEEDAIDARKKRVVCRKCKRKGDERLLCVICFMGVHPACHNPRIRKIPRGSWYCQKCREDRNRRLSRKRR